MACLHVHDLGGDFTGNGLDCLLHMLAQVFGIILDGICWQKLLRSVGLVSVGGGRFM